MIMQHALGKNMWENVQMMFEQTYFEYIFYHLNSCKFLCPHGLMSTYPTKRTTPPSAGLLCLCSGNVHFPRCLGSQGDLHGYKKYIYRHELSLKLAEQDGGIQEVALEVVSSPGPGNQLEAIYI